MEPTKRLVFGVESYHTTISCWWFKLLDGYFGTNNLKDELKALILVDLMHNCKGKQNSTDPSGHAIIKIFRSGVAPIFFKK